MIKRAIKMIPGVRSILFKKLLNTQYRYDKTFFEENYSHSKKTQRKIGYNMLLIVHSLEKGMSNREPRRFGVEKVKQLMALVDDYVSFGDFEDNYEFVCAINILRNYSKFYEQHGWTNEKEYTSVLDFLRRFQDTKTIDIGSRLLRKSDFLKDSEIDYRRFLASRHSVREFSDARLSEKDFKQAVKTAILSPSACNRQMCKAYYVKDKGRADELIRMAQGFGGFDKKTINLIVVTFDVNANYMVGERNQGWFNAGLFSMNLVNAMHAMGIGSCFCQFGNNVKDEDKIKELLSIPSSERIAVLIAAGYYCDEMLIPYSPRKEINDVGRVR